MNVLEQLISQLDVAGDLAAAKVIARISRYGKRAVPFLVFAAKDISRPRVRKWSLEALGSVPDPRALPVLHAALFDERMGIRLHALRALRKLKSRNSLKKIERMLRDRSGGIRVNALYALAEFGDKRAGDSVLRALRDPEWYVRQNACVACGMLGLKGSLAKLRRLEREDPRKAVRVAAAAAITRLERA